MPQFSPAERRALEALARDLERVTGPRLRSVVAYRGHQAHGPIHSCAIADALTFQDLAACLPLVDTWHRHALAVPLLLATGELQRTLDAFPLEYAAIAADHLVLRGDDPFASLAVAPADLRRACETQAKSQVIHLREGFLESHGEVRAIARLIAQSAGPFRALLTNLARLPTAGTQIDSRTLSDEALAAMAEQHLGVPAALVRDVFAAEGPHASTVVDPSALLLRYLDAAQKIWAFVDGGR
ncbi:MAG: hypothetical protein ACRD1V_13605 [Vicinamibacterales bacterium]